MRLSGKVVATLFHRESGHRLKIRLK